MSLVSTIIPVFNRPEMLRATIASVLAQTYRPIEIVIVDDGSTDNTFAVAQEIARDHPDEVMAITIANAGPGGARQAGIEKSSGDYIQFLDSDDYLLPEKFALQVSALAADPESVASYGKTRFYARGEEQPPQTAGRRTGERISHMFPAHLQARWWATSTPLFRRTACIEAGPWTTLRNEEDWEYECRIAKNGGKLAFVDEFVSEHNLHDGERLSSHGSSDPLKLRDRATAQALIFEHAHEAGITSEQPEMKHFSRRCFLLARQCGAVGLQDEAAMLFALARRAATPHAARGGDFLVVGTAARIFGWRVVGRVSRFVDRFRKPGPR